MAEVTDLIKNSQFSYSFEVTPEVSENELNNLHTDPLFYSITWHAKSHRCKDMNIDTLRTAKLLRSRQKNVLLHMSCDLMKMNYLKQLMVILKENDICNLFVILGENYDPENSDFENTTQLIKFIREQTGEYFCIGIAGFPDCSDKKILQMRGKIESGANFILTQAFFDFNTFKTFKERCEKLNIKVPIIPGLFAFESYKQLSGFINLCKIKACNDLLNIVQNNENCSTDIIRILIQDLKNICGVNHVHIFTLNNLKRVNKFLQNCYITES